MRAQAWMNARTRADFIRISYFTASSIRPTAALAKGVMRWRVPSYACEFQRCQKCTGTTSLHATFEILSTHQKSPWPWLNLCHGPTPTVLSIHSSFASTTTITITTLRGTGFDFAWKRKDRCSLGKEPEVNKGGSLYLAPGCYKDCVVSEARRLCEVHGSALL